MSNFNLGATVGSSGNSKLTVADFVLVQTGTYQDQAIRPFNINTSVNIENQLISATRGGMNLGVAAVQELAADVVAPQAQVEGWAGIANGFRCRRFRFLMKVIEQHPFIVGTTTQRIFFGYTDNCDASQNFLDPNMRIYFNSETIIADVIRNTVHGPQRNVNILASNQIVSPINMAEPVMGSAMFARPTSHLIRPEDTFSIQQTTEVAKMLSETGMVDATIDKVIVHGSMVGEGGAYKYSRRHDTSPTRYLSDSLQAYHHAVKESTMENLDHDGMPTSYNREVMLGEAAKHCQNQNIQSNSFLNVLKGHAAYMEQGFILYKDLVRLFPETDQRDSRSTTKFAMDNGQSIRKVNFAEHSQTMGGADHTSIAVSLLAQTIPSVMMDTFFRTVSFAVTNGTGHNNYLFEIHPQNCKSIVDGIDMRPYIQEFERRLKTDVLNSISRGNQLPFQISMYSDLVGDSVIDIVIGGGATERFIAPTFSDSLFSPIITRNEELPNLIARDLTHLVSQVIQLPNTNAAMGAVGYQHPVAQPALINPNMMNMQPGVSSNVPDLGLL